MKLSDQFGVLITLKLNEEAEVPARVLVNEAFAVKAPFVGFTENVKT